MPIANELISILGFKVTGEGEVKRYNKMMDDVESSAKERQYRIGALGKAAGALTIAAIGVGTSAVKNFAAFERQMTRIGITAGATSSEVVNASEEVQRLARDLALPVSDAVQALDTLTASGLDLGEAMAFLPSVLTTAQAAGAATNDIANTALKAASALKIEAKDMQNAFDIMVAGGKAGQFELKDMATYIPDMANQFANMGYQGEEGLKKLIAVLQTLREDTGSASAAATNATNIFSKMFSQETEKRFKEFGVNIRSEMDKAKKNGEDAIDAYVRLSREVLDKNPTAKISDLFSDQQFQQGMLSLITSTDRLEYFFNVLNNTDVKGGSMRDANTVINDTTASLQRLSTSWDMFMKSVGAGLSGPVSAVLDAGTGFLTYDAAVQAGRKKRGYEWYQNLWYGSGEKDQLAREGGYAPTSADRTVKAIAPDAYRVLGRMPQRPRSTVSRGGQTMGADSRQSDAATQSQDQDRMAAKLAARVEEMNANLAKMTNTATAGATITDARQDNSDRSVTANVTVNQTVNSADAATRQAAQATGNAVGKAATDAATRLEVEPNF